MGRKTPPTSPFLTHQPPKHRTRFHPLRFRLEQQELKPIRAHVVSATIIRPQVVAVPFIPAPHGPPLMLRTFVRRPPVTGVTETICMLLALTQSSVSFRNVSMSPSKGLQIVSPSLSSALWKRRIFRYSILIINRLPQLRVHG